MSTRQYTKKPCPMCGRKARRYNEEHDDTKYYGYDRHIKDPACHDCMQIWNAGKHYLELCRTQIGEEGYVLARIPEQPHWYPSFYTPGSDRAELDTLSGLMRELILSVVEEVQGVQCKHDDSRFTADREEGLGRQWQGTDIVVRVKRSTRDVIRRLYAQIAKCLNEEYKAGRKRGHNILLELADGQMSPQEFNAIQSPKERA